MEHAPGATLQRTVEGAGVSTVVALDVAAVMVAAAVVLMVRARRAARAASITTLVFDSSPAGMALSDTAGRLRAVNATLARWCAATSQALVGCYLGDPVEPADVGALAAVLGGGPASGTPGSTAPPPPA